MFCKGVFLVSCDMGLGTTLHTRGGFLPTQMWLGLRHGAKYLGRFSPTQLRLGRRHDASYLGSVSAHSDEAWKETWCNIFSEEFCLLCLDMGRNTVLNIRGRCLLSQWRLGLGHSATYFGMSSAGPIEVWVERVATCLKVFFPFQLRHGLGSVQHVSGEFQPTQLRLGCGTGENV